MTSSRLTLPIVTVAFVALAGLGTHQLFKDGSFWLDEASLALSLLQLEPLQSFGPLVGGQSFPRLYLLAVHGLVGAFGYETMVVRLLPYLFFVAATFAWLRLLSERFRNEPLWIVLGALLLAVSIICGQVTASLVYDHHGWLGYPTINLSPSRVLGALLIVVGVVLVARK